jgi:hypothetical protein
MGTIKGTADYQIMIYAVENYIEEVKAFPDGPAFQKYEDHQKIGCFHFMDGAAWAYEKTLQLLTDFMEQQIARDDATKKEIAAEQAAEQDARDLRAYSQAVL